MIFPWRNCSYKTQLRILTNELTYQSLNRALPSRKCSIKTSAKCKTSVFVLLEIWLQWSEWLGPYFVVIIHYSGIFENLNNFFFGSDSSLLLPPQQFKEIVGSKGPYCVDNHNFNNTYYISEGQQHHLSSSQ